MLWECSFWCWGNDKLRILEYILLSYYWQRQWQLVLHFTCVLEEAFCMLRRCFSVSNNLCITSELESPDILDSIWVGGVAKQHMPTLYVIWIRILPQGSNCFDSLLGLNLKKPSGQSMASGPKFAFSFTFWLGRCSRGSNLTSSFLKVEIDVETFLLIISFCNINNVFSLVLHAHPQRLVLSMW